MHKALVAMQLHWPADEHHKQLLNIHLKEWLNITSTDTQHFMAKPLADQQTFSNMLGYCQKDHNRQHFDARMHNITAEELTNGRVDYGKVAFDYKQGCRELDR